VRVLALFVGVVIMLVVGLIVFNAVLKTDTVNVPNTPIVPLITTPLPSAVQPGPGLGGAATSPAASPTVQVTQTTTGAPAPVRPGQAVACSTDRATVEAAVVLFTQLQGHPPANQNELISAGFLRSPSTLHDVRGGQVVGIGGCP
jgi:hypothetical protein